MASGAFRTLWQSLEQVWLPQGRLRPQDLPQGAGFEAWQGQSEVSWPPRQVTGTGQGQGADQEEGVDHDPEGEGVTDPEVDHPEEVSRQMATGSILAVRAMSIRQMPKQ